MKTKALGEICRPKQWKTVSVSQLCENGYPVYGANGVIGKYKDFNHKKETILVTCRGATCGTLNICAPFSYVNGNAMALDSLDKSVDLRYLYFFLKGRGFHDVISGSAQPQIIRSAIERIEVPICNIGTQKEITKRFTKIEDIIKNKKRLLADLDNLIKARFVEMFGDFDLAPQRNEWIKLSELGEIVSGSTPKTGTAEYWDGDICWITPAELNSMSGIVYDSKKKITEAGRNSCSLRLMPIDTVILSSRAPIGKVAILGKEMCCNQGFKNIICNEKILPKYLYYLLAYNTDYLNSLGRGATFKEISKKIVEDIRIPLPLIEQQAKFITFSEQVDKSKFALSNELAMGNFYIRLIHDCIMHGCIDL